MPQTPHTPDAADPANTELPRAGDRYATQRILGEGGLAQVYSATDQLLRREVALKFINATSKHSAERFKDEAQITAQLQHPNIIPVYDLATAPDGRQVLAMKPVNGRTLSEVIADAHRSTGGKGVGDHLRSLLGIFMRLCDGVAYAHSRGVIHRDLKPANVMVGEFGEVLVMDWGLARPVGTPAGDADESDDGRDVLTTDLREDGGLVTLDGAVRGTPGYLAPEQALGSTDLDQQTDVYALGAILYTILTGRLHLNGKTPQALIAATRSGAVVPPHVRAPAAKVPRELASIAMMALKRRRSERFESVADLQAEVGRYLDGELVRCARYSLRQRFERYVRRHPTRVSLAAFLAILALITGLAASWLHSAEIEKQRAREAARSAELERQAAETKAGQARAAQMAAEGRYSEAMQEFGVRAIDESKAVREEFRQLYLASPSYENPVPGQYFPELDPEKLRRYLDAYDRLFELHAFDPVHVRVSAEDYEFRARLRLAAGDLDGVIEDYTSAIELDPDYHRAWAGRAGTRNNTGDPEGALADFARAIQLAPERASHRFNRSIAFAKLERWTEAISDLDVALRKDPGNPRYLHQLAGIHLELGDYDAAMRDLDALLAVVPDHIDGLWNRANLNLKLDDSAAAMRDLDALLAEVPDHIGGLTNRANLNLRLDDRDAAMRDLDALLAVVPDHIDGLWMRANLNRRLRDRDAAMRDLDALLAEVPDHINGLRSRASLNLRMGFLERCDADATRIIELGSARWPIFLTRACARARLGRTDEARADFDHAELLSGRPAEGLSPAVSPEAARDTIRKARQRLLGE